MITEKIAHHNQERMKEKMASNSDIHPLVKVLLDGDQDQAVTEAKALLEAGLNAGGLSRRA